MDKLEVVAWTAKKNLAWLRGAAFREATMFSWEPAGQYIALTPHAPAQAEIDRLREEVPRLEASLRTVQNAATTLHRSRDTELAHLRENAAFDQRLRQEHQSLMDRDALMTDALLAAEAEIDRLRGEVAEWKGSAEALGAKLDALTPEGTCGCSIDAPGDVCQHHSPALVAMTARAMTAEAEVARLTALNRELEGLLVTQGIWRKNKDTPHD